MHNAAADTLCPGIDAIVTACQPIATRMVWPRRPGNTSGTTHKINMSWAGTCAACPEEAV